MVVYTIYADNKLIHHSESSSPEVKLINPKLSMEENSSGSFSCTIPPSNVGYDYITRLTTEIIIKRQTVDSQTGLLGKEKEIWSGRVIDEKIDFFNNRQITCEGALSYLNDTIQPQAKYENYTPGDMLRALINKHNDRKTPQIKKGVTIKFDYRCKTENSFDYLRVYYRKVLSDIYEYIQLTGEFGNREINIPANEFFIYWHTDTSLHNYYGYKIESVAPYVGYDYTTPTSSSTLPPYTSISVGLNNLPESDHDPYMDSSDELYFVQTDFNRVFVQDFRVGTVTVNDPDTQVGFTTYETNFESTMDDINSKLLNICGGHLVLRRNESDGYNYIDYLEEYSKLNNQKIEFGKNLLDFSKSFDVSSICTVIIPLGERLEGKVDDDMDSYLTVESVNSGSMYIVNEDAVNNFGWIEKVVHFDDVEDASILKRKAERYLQDTQFEKLTLELTAVDMHYLGIDDGELFELYDMVHCTSKPHGLDRTFPIKKVEIPIDNPQNTTFTIGDNVVANTLSSSLTSSNVSINAKIDALPSTTSVLKEAKRNADQLMRQLSNGYISTIIEGTDENAHSEAQVISNAQNLYEDATKFWIWNINGLAHYSGTWAQYKAGIGQLDTAITMDGTIVANRILTGTLGKPGSGNYWNMETGEFHLGLGESYVGSKSTSNQVATTGNISTAVSNYDTSLSDEKVFNKLTRNGSVQGIARVWNSTTQNYQLYINASYINTGTMAADRIKGGTLQDQQGNMTWDLNNGTMTAKKLTFDTDKLYIDGTYGNITSRENRKETGSKAYLNQGGLTFYYNNNWVGGIYANYDGGYNELAIQANTITINGVRCKDSNDNCFVRASNGQVMRIDFAKGYCTGYNLEGKQLASGWINFIHHIEEDSQGVLHWYGGTFYVDQGVIDYDTYSYDQ